MLLGVNVEDFNDVVANNIHVPLVEYHFYKFKWLVAPYGVEVFARFRLLL